MNQEKTYCKDCKEETTPGAGSARCPRCWDNRLDRSSSNLFRIQLSYATFGVIDQEGVITETAPIGSWMVGKSVAEIQQWVTSKKGTMEWINEIST